MSIIDSICNFIVILTLILLLCMCLFALFCFVGFVLDLCKIVPEDNIVRKSWINLKEEYRNYNNKIENDKKEEKFEKFENLKFLDRKNIENQLKNDSNSNLSVSKFNNSFTSSSTISSFPQIQTSQPNINAVD